MTTKLGPREHAIGLHWTQVETPAPFVDLPTLSHNLATMAERATEMVVDIRPHFKAHKCVELARMQVEAGAVGLTVATANEALALLDAGINDVLVANQVVQPTQIEKLAGRSPEVRLAVFVDDPTNLIALATAARKKGGEIGVFVEADSGMGRCGTGGPEEARQLATLADQLDGVRFEGVSAYEGHTTPIEDSRERSLQTREAIEAMVGSAEAIRADGIAVATISAGGTSTYMTTGADPRVTEIQPGAYALMDVARRNLLDDFAIALSVSATVISRQRTRAVLDCGHKAICSQQAPSAPVGAWGEITALYEEHLVFTPTAATPALGEQVRLYPGYGPMTVNLYDRLYVLSEEHVVAEWQIAARR